MRFDIQRANMWKRISAYILDLILLCIVTTGGMYLLSAVTGYDGQTAQLEASYAAYAAEFGMETFDISAAAYEAFTEEERALYDAAYEALLADPALLRTYSMVVNLTIVITTLAILLAYGVVEFAVPLILGNGQTVGKKIFGLGVIRCDGVKMSTFMLFVRTLLGKFTVETMIPVMLVLMLLFNAVGLTGLCVIGLLLLLQLILLIVTRHRTVIHDAFAQTVVVDLASQMVFDTPEELLAYTAKLAAERAARSEY